MAKQAPEDSRIGRPRAVAALLPKVTAKALGKRGFAVAAVITDWIEIVGNELAAMAQPLRIAFARNKRDGGTLHVRASGAAATELQHLEPQILERINGYFGFRAVARLKIHHGPAAPVAPSPTAAAPKSSTGQAIENLEDRVAGVEDPDLRDALKSLGDAIQGRARGTS
ncbi:MAG: DUF721 domain-containing protein [Kiloniellales bacterium]